MSPAGSLLALCVTTLPLLGGGARASAERVGDGPGLTRDQFERRVFKKWDRDGDGRVTETEWRAGVHLLWGRPQGKWPEWDRDGDARLDFREVKEGLEKRGLYEQVDANGDGVIDDEELAAWLLNVFDADRAVRIQRFGWEATRLVPTTG